MKPREPFFKQSMSNASGGDATLVPCMTIDQANRFVEPLLEKCAAMEKCALQAQEMAKEIASENEQLRAENDRLRSAQMKLEAEIGLAPVVYASWENIPLNENNGLFVSGVTDTWRTDYHDVSRAKFKARLVRIEEIKK